MRGELDKSNNTKTKISLMIDERLNNDLNDFKKKYRITKSDIINGLLEKYLREEFGNPK